MVWQEIIRTHKIMIRNFVAEMSNCDCYSYLAAFKAMLNATLFFLLG